jgi:hypothetical protein
MCSTSRSSAPCAACSARCAVPEQADESRVARGHWLRREAIEVTLLWTWPIALAGLAALLLPVLLHLDRRRTLQTLRFAALRWLGSSHPARRTFRLTEWLLLALRLLLLASVVLWLAQPLLRDAQRAAHTWVAVVPGVAAADIATLARDPEHAVWLARGFPRIDTPMPSGEHEIASLLREFDASLAAQDGLIVVVPPELGGLDAAAIELGRAVDWRIASNGNSMTSATASVAVASRVLALRYERADDPSLPILRAAIAAWNVSPSLAVQLDEGDARAPLPPKVDAVVWLGATPGTSAASRALEGSTLLHIGAAAAAASAALPDVVDHWRARLQRVGKGHQLSLPASLPTLDPEGVRSAGFARSLHQLLFGAPRLPDRARAVDVVPRQVSLPARIPEQPLRPWLAWIVAGLFLLERAVASGTRLAKAP